VSLGEIH